MPYSENVNVLPGYVTAAERHGIGYKAQTRHGNQSWKRLPRSSPAELPVGLSPSLSSAAEASRGGRVAFPWGTNSEGPTVYALRFIPCPFPTLPLACSYDGLEPAAFRQSLMTPSHTYPVFHKSKLRTPAEMVGHRSFELPA